MGLEISVVKTKKELDLEHLYSIKDAVEDAFDWYLHGDREGEERADHFRGLQEFAKTLDKKAVLSAYARHLEDGDGYDEEDDKPKLEYLENIPETEFNELLKYMADSIGEYHIGNTHLFFEWEKMPGEDIITSCSYNLRELLRDCCKTRPENYILWDSLYELDPKLLKDKAKRWKKYRRTLKIMKWIGFFMPKAGWRMLDDFIDQHCCNMRDAGFNDLIYYANELEKVADSIEPNFNYWLTNSY